MAEYAVTEADGALECIFQERVSSNPITNKLRYDLQRMRRVHFKSNSAGNEQLRPFLESSFV